MQIIKSLLGLSASPLGLTKFDTTNRFLLRKESNFQLGLKNCIQPLGAKSSLVNCSKLLLPRQDKTVHDENTWNIDLDFDALIECSTPVLENQVETNDLLSQEEQVLENDNNFSSDINFIESFTTIIIDSLPGTTLIDNSTINSTEDNYHNLTNISDINQEAVPNKKSDNLSKKAKTKKSTAKTNKNIKNTNKIPKKSKTTVNTAPEINQLKLNDNLTDHDVLKTSPPTPLLKGEGNPLLPPPSLLGKGAGELGFPNNVESQNDNNFQLDSLVKQNQLEAKNVSQDEHIATSPQVIVHDLKNKSHVNGDIDSDIDSNININLKEISNQESILNPEVNTNFDNVQEIEASQETKNITKLNNQEKPVITQSVPKITLKPLEDNSAFDKSDNSQDSIYQNISEFIKQPIQEREEIKQQHTDQSSITSQPISIYREISSVEPIEIINTVGTSEHPENLIQNIPVEHYIDLELPITETVINNDVIDITENQAPVIQDNTQANTYIQLDLNTLSLTSPLIKERQEFGDIQRQDEVITTHVTSYNINTQENNFEANHTIYPVQNTDFTIQKVSQENLEKSYYIPANSSENANIATNLTNSSELILTDSKKELLPGANLDILDISDLSDITVIQKSIQHNSADQTTDEIKSNLQLNNIPSEISTQNINKTDFNVVIVDENLVIHEQALPEISTKIVDDLDTETLTNITDSKNILLKLPESSSENLPNDLSSNLFNNLQNKPQAPTGYATGGLVAHSNTSDNPTIAPSDTVPAMLTPGEFVINVRDAQKNINILRHINSGGTLPEDITTPVKPSIEQTEENDDATERLDSFQPSTKVDIQTSLTNVISPKLTGSEIRSPGINAPNSIQFNTFDNSVENSNQNLTTGVNNNSHQYSSPPLIFRQANTSNTTKVYEHNISTDIPLEWGSVEELLNGSADSTNNSASDNLEEFIFSKSAPSISTQRLPAVQGFALGGEVTASDIATDIEPVTETIQRLSDSNASDSSKEENENDSLDLETLAHQIYSRLRQRLEIERERYGAYSGRLPW
ncbi:hypothetical protein NIES2101_19210 [Calothrix sp. HK-06]|nr:hypothetical protein NIES2101_19210 [Calothrix sp. HK-06]